ncbi:hypothetical protein K5D57_15050 [Pseudomonas cichorii]|nr:hypothetical protein [Pseudomonas cichorii]MBX8561020.1 hypothetical protein [Pseudomonas cichorii]
MLNPLIVMGTAWRHLYKILTGRSQYQALKTLPRQDHNPEHPKRGTALLAGFLLLPSAKQFGCHFYVNAIPANG